MKRIGERTGFVLPLHARMLRQAAATLLADAGHDTRAISGLAWPSQYVRYIELSPTRFKKFW
jgi:hypothetical protein